MRLSRVFLAKTNTQCRVVALDVGSLGVHRQWDMQCPGGWPSRFAAASGGRWESLQLQLLTARVFAMLSLPLPPPPPPRLCVGFLPAEHIHLDHHLFEHQQQLHHHDEFIDVYFYHFNDGLHFF